MSFSRILGLVSLLALAAGLGVPFACVNDRPLRTSCPCAPGWVCIQATQTCVREQSADASGQAGGSVGASGASGAAQGGASGQAGSLYVGHAGGDGHGVIDPSIDPSYPDGCQALLPPANTTPGTPVAGCPCTRRPGPGNSYQCAQGINESWKQTIGPEGGGIDLEAQQHGGTPFVITFPPGAVEAPVEVTITETNLSPPVTFEDYSPIYRVAPIGLKLQKIAKLDVPFGNSIGGASGPTGIMIYQSSPSNPCDFEPLVDSNNVVTGTMEASMTRGGYFFVGLPKPASSATCP